MRVMLLEAGGVVALEKLREAVPTASGVMLLGSDEEAEADADRSMLVDSEPEMDTDSEALAVNEDDGLVVIDGEALKESDDVIESLIDGEELIDGDGDNDALADKDSGGEGDTLKTAVDAAADWLSDEVGLDEELRGGADCMGLVVTVPAVNTEADGELVLDGAIEEKDGVFVAEIVSDDKELPDDEHVEDGETV